MLRAATATTRGEYKLASGGLSLRLPLLQAVCHQDVCFEDIMGQPVQQLHSLAKHLDFNLDEVGSDSRARHCCQRPLLGCSEQLHRQHPPLDTLTVQCCGGQA